MDINMLNENVYISGETIITKNIICNNIYVEGNLITKGNQNVIGYQNVRGYQYVIGYQYVGGNQDVIGYQYVIGNQDVIGYQYVIGNQDIRGNQDVGAIILNLYCKWNIIVFKDLIKIGCKEKSVKEWDIFFKENKSYETDNTSNEYSKIKVAYEIAKIAQNQLLLMQKK